MIVAIILADRADLKIEGEPVYFLPIGGQSVIESVAETVLRGPFGVTLVVTAPELSKRMQEALAGYAVQFVVAPKESALKSGLDAAEQFRARWKKAMQAAGQRFSKQKPDAKKEWEQHRKSGDVKVRGLARSFDRDGTMLFRGEQPGITKELQARLIEAFAREESALVVRPVFQGVQYYPAILAAGGSDPDAQSHQLNAENAADVQQISSVADYDSLRSGTTSKMIK